MAINVGLPGIGASTTATYRSVLLTDLGAAYVPQNYIIDASGSRDPGNTDDVTVLRAGLLLTRDGRAESDSVANDMYATTILGLTTADAALGATSISVPAATATEITRRYGTSGDAEVYIVYLGGSDGLTVTCEGIAHTDVGTDSITVDPIGEAIPSGSIVVASEAVENEATAQLYNTIVISDGYGIKVTNDSGTNVNQECPRVLGSGQINTGSLIDYPDAEELQDWYKDTLTRYTIGMRFNDEM